MFNISVLHGVCIEAWNHVLNYKVLLYLPCEEPLSDTDYGRTCETLLKAISLASDSEPI
jgi:hypothetical protein